MPIEFAALVMAGGECGAGIMLMLGRLVRPVAAVLIGAFTFFALTLGETPLLHANLYAVMMLYLAAGDGRGYAPRPLRWPGGMRAGRRNPQFPRLGHGRMA